MYRHIIDIYYTKTRANVLHVEKLTAFFARQNEGNMRYFPKTSRPSTGIPRGGIQSSVGRTAGGGSSYKGFVRDLLIARGRPVDVMQVGFIYELIHSSIDAARADTCGAAGREGDKGGIGRVRAGRGGGDCVGSARPRRRWGQEIRAI
jgi:hypothetical protein